MTSQITSKSLTHKDYTVGWVCALPKERTAATAILDQRHADLAKPENDPNAYTLGSIHKHNIVIVCLPKGKISLIPAATVAAEMVSTFPSIKFGLMVGIGGGIPPKVRLGDVVVSTPVGQFPGVVQWDFGKAEEGGNLKRTGALNNPPNALLAALGKLEAEHELNVSKIPKYLDDLKKSYPTLVPKYIRSDSLQDILFAPDNPHRNRSRWQVIFLILWGTIFALLKYLLGSWDFTPRDRRADHVTSTTVSTSNVEGDGDEEDNCRYCDMTRVIKRIPRDMRIHYGLIASGNQVIKDATLRDKLNTDLGGDVLCVEMEAAGLMYKFPCIVIRGICDYADSHKNKKWQEHAAAVAAAFAKELLEYIQPSDVDGERTAKDILNQG